jgi:hypothetical protein
MDAKYSANDDDVWQPWPPTGWQRRENADETGRKGKRPKRTSLVSINLYTPRSSRGNHKKREKEMNEK